MENNNTGTFSNYNMISNKFWVFIFSVWGRLLGTLQMTSSSLLEFYRVFFSVSHAYETDLIFHLDGLRMGDRKTSIVGGLEDYKNEMERMKEREREGEGEREKYRGKERHRER